MSFSPLAQTAASSSANSPITSGTRSVLLGKRKAAIDDQLSPSRKKAPSTPVRPQPPITASSFPQVMDLTDPRKPKPSFDGQASMEESGTVLSFSDKESVTSSVTEQNILSASSDPIQSQLLATDNNYGSGGDDIPTKAELISIGRPKRNRTKKTA